MSIRCKKTDHYYKNHVALHAEYPHLYSSILLYYHFHFNIKELVTINIPVHCSQRLRKSVTWNLITLTSMTESIHIETDGRIYKLASRQLWKKKKVTKDEMEGSLLRTGLWNMPKGICWKTRTDNYEDMSVNQRIMTWVIKKHEGYWLDSSPSWKGTNEDLLSTR
jgi:hypothetical protein